MMARLAGILALLFVLGFIAAWLRARQRAALAGQAAEAGDGRPLLLSVVSRHCAACPSQKHILAEVGAHYPAASLRLDVLDAEAEPERVRALHVMTVPTTLLFAADGRVVHINQGLVGLETLKRQVDGLLAHGGQTGKP